MELDTDSPTKKYSTTVRLIFRTTLYFLICLVPILLGGGYFMFHYLDHELKHAVKEELIFDKMHWIKYLQNESADSTPFRLNSPEIIILKTNRPPQFKPIIKDTLILQEFEKEYDPYRQLSQVVDIRGTHYFILIRKSLLERKDLIQNISIAMCLVLLSVLIVTLLFNWFITKRIWKPFYQTLYSLRNLKLNQLETFNFKITETIEFNELNVALEIMAKKIHQDYITLKEFTEDAAHEMQTPLSIAQSKLEILLQDPTLGESQLQMVVQTSEALSRLSRLNSSLLLLAKIENLQFIIDTPIGLRSVIEKYTSLFQEFLLDKSIIVHWFIQEDFLIGIHPILADTLISNLLGNAIKYNIPNGNIWINISNDGFSIKNSSSQGAIETERLFKRFKKSSSGMNNASNGLGLSIVKKITDTHQLSFEYRFLEGNQEFIVHSI